MSKKINTNPWPDRSLKIVAYILTTIWVVLGFIPAFWMLTSAFKNLVDANRIPPVWIPPIPQRVEIALDYTNAAGGKTRQELRKLVQDEAMVSQWYAFDKLRKERIGEVVVKGYQEGKLFYKSSLTYADFTSWRNKIWATTYLSKKQVLRQKNEVERLVKGQEQFVVKPSVSYQKKDGSTTLTKSVERYLPTMDLQGEILGISQSHSFSRLFDNFIIAWRTSKTAENPLGWGRYISNSVLITIAAVLLQWFVGAAAAYALSWLLTDRWSKYFTLFFLATMMIPPTVTLIPLYGMIQSWGLISNLLAVILPSIPNAFAIYMFKGFFDGLPKELFEAARIDGANDWQIYRALVMPLSKSVFMAIGVMVFLNYWNGGNLLYNYLVLKDTASWTFPLALYNSVGAGAQNMSLTMAMTIITSIPTLIIFIFFKNSIKEGMLLGAIKM